MYYFCVSGFTGSSSSEALSCTILLINFIRNCLVSVFEMHLLNSCVSFVEYPELCNQVNHVLTSCICSFFVNPQISYVY